jgi:GT2 family glycosyltransferase
MRADESEAMNSGTGGSFKLSVVVPTHNPRPDYLARVLKALERQTLPKADWELTVVDNASEGPLADYVNLSWQPNAALVREEKLGLTPARLAGISRSKGSIVVFVDDDNELYEDYLEQALAIADKYPFVGVWGGQVFGEFEDPDSLFARKYPGCYTVRSFEGAMWTNRKRDYAIMPIGAGLCARLDLLRRYADICAADPRRTVLDRTGNKLLTCGDLDIVFTVCDLGFGKGLFPELKLTHLIPNKRLNEGFITGNAEGNQYSATIQNYLVDNELPEFTRTLEQRAMRSLRLMRMEPLQRRIAEAEARGRRKAVADLFEWGWVAEGQPVIRVRVD